MDRNLTVKSVFIIVLVIVAFWTFYPPTKTLKPGIDLAGGTSLIYEIDTHGLKESEKRGLSGRMITVLRRRIDPANIQNLIWRPQGNTRFEIQMPLASAEARAKRRIYEKAEDELLEENINPAVIIRSLRKSPAERAEDFNDIAKGSPAREEILKELTTAYDKHRELRNKSDSLVAELEAQKDEISAAGLGLDQIEPNLGYWATLDEQQLAKSLKDFLGSDDNLELVSEHVKTYAEWDEVTKKIMDAETGTSVRYKNAKKELDKLNLTKDEIDFVLGKPVKGGERSKAIEELKLKFPDRAERIDKVAAAFEEYRPYRGRLDDPKDLQRMLKGAGILEFRRP